MKLEDIGFYTLEDERAKNVSLDSPLWRCELILTSRCNFACPYCRGVEGFKGDLPFEDAKEVVQQWVNGGLKNIRFSGGEPTLYPKLNELVECAKNGGIEHVAISTNGYSDISLYESLWHSGVDDFSISLDACCSSVGDMMAGNIDGAWNKVIDNIKIISGLAYTTVGIVMDDSNIGELENMAEFAYSLGVSDIRILSAAQWNNKEKFKNLCSNKQILSKNPILKYRVENFNNGRNVRGISKDDTNICRLMYDDMVVMDNKHYPCIIHMREKGMPIGTTKGKTIEEIRLERSKFLIFHDSYQDPICKNNCLDVCVDYNNKVESFK